MRSIELLLLAALSTGVLYLGPVPAQASDDDLDETSPPATVLSGDDEEEAPSRPAGADPDEFDEIEAAPGVDPEAGEVEAPGQPTGDDPDAFDEIEAAPGVDPEAGEFEDGEAGTPMPRKAALTPVAVLGSLVAIVVGYGIKRQL